MLRFLKKFLGSKANDATTEWKIGSGDKFEFVIENKDGEYLKITNKTEDGYIRQYYSSNGHSGCIALTNKLKSVIFEMQKKGTR
jgi:hypothetical protein